MDQDFTKQVELAYGRGKFLRFRRYSTNGKPLVRGVQIIRMDTLTRWVNEGMPIRPHVRVSN